ncbi:MAG: S9 family peptidase [Gemmatimonadota bacterium]|nr:MAG: S9 family peptidase [Gemmatimonadota bacterium]
MRFRRLFAITAAAALAHACTSARSVQHYSVADFYENDQFFGASFSPDNSKLLVTSNVSGVYNAYTIPVAGGEPQALTESTDDAVFAVSFFPTDERILYSQDRGGNELNHLFVRNPDGSVADLTPGETLKATFSGWAHDDRSFFVQTNERDVRLFDLYEYDVDTYERTLIFENDEALTFGGISPDKRYIAFVQPYTTSDADILLHDREDNTTINITEHTGDVANAPADFTPDGSALLYVSDQDQEFAALYRYDIGTGERTPLLAPNWDIAGASYTKSGRYLRVSTNEEARFITRVYQADNLEPVELSDLPDGLIRGMQFTDDDSHIAFYTSDGSAPDDLWAGPLDGTPVRLTDGLSAAIQRDDLVAPEHVWFTSYDGVEVPGLLYKPHQVSRSAPAPAMVMVHGGPGGQATVGYRALTQALVNSGYVVFDINNRGSSGYGKSFFKMDDQQHGEADLGDVVASKQMLIETGYVDPDRIGIIGGSYGGYMVLAALTLQPDEFAVGVDLFGISNWLRTLNSIPPWWESFREALYQEMGDPATDSVRLHRISPLFNADQIRSPLMVLQGANDPRVLQVESDEIVEAARAQGVPVEYVIFEDEGHGFVKKENEIEGYTKVIEFLDRHLKGSEEM